MKKIFTTLTLIALIIAANSFAFSQTKDLNIVSLDQTISFLLSENKKAKDLIAAQNDRILSLEAENTAERENSASLSKSYEKALSEIDSLKTSNAALSRAVALNESTVAMLQEDNKKQRSKAKKATKDKWIAYAALAGTLALKLLIP